MAYQMLDIGDRVRVGITSAGDANIEVYDKPRTDPDSNMEEVSVPVHAVLELGAWLMRYGR